MYNLQLCVFVLGKDDKYWTGYFGPYISAAGVRVKKESKPAKDDSFSDIDQVYQSLNIPRNYNQL